MSTELLAIILGTGGAAFLAAVVQAWRSIRSGAAQHERDAYSDLERSRQREYNRRERAELERDYWHAWAGQLEFLVRTRLPVAEMPERPPWPPNKKVETDVEDTVA